MIHRRLIAKGIKYYLTLPHNTGHGIHSPFLFRLINEVIVRNPDINDLRKIENYRHILVNNSDKLKIYDLGARAGKVQKIKKVSDIAQNESTTPHYGKMIFNLVKEYKPQTTVELGTSLGIGTLYLALAASTGKVYSIEGSTEKAALATSMLKEYVDNVDIIPGSFDEKLPELHERIQKIDIAFIDGNHKKESTLHYFNLILKYCHHNSVLIIDDINWSPGMMEAWREIQKSEKVRVCLDFFRLGVVFLDPKLQKENFTVFY